MPKMTYSEVGSMLLEASRGCLTKTGSYATITGTYESIITGLVADLPSHKQLEVKRALETTARYIEQVYAKTS